MQHLPYLDLLYSINCERNAIGAREFRPIKIEFSFYFFSSHFPILVREYLSLGLWFMPMHERTTWKLTAYSIKNPVALQQDLLEERKDKAAFHSKSFVLNMGLIHKTCSQVFQMFE